MTMLEYPFHVLKVPAGITATQFGLAFDPTLDGADLTSKDDDVRGPWLEHKTATPAVGTPASGGIITSMDVVKGLWRPVIELAIRTPTGASSISDMRIWAGLFSVKPDAIQTPTTGQHFAAFRYDPSVGGPDANKWHRVTSGGGTPQVDPLELLPDVALGTQYSLKVVILTNTVEFWINGNLQETSTVFPGTATLLGFGVRVTRLAMASAAKAIEWSRVSWTYTRP